MTNNTTSKAGTPFIFDDIEFPVNGEEVDSCDADTEVVPVSAFLPHNKPNQQTLKAAAKLKAMQISDQSICRSQKWTSEQWIEVQAMPEFISELELEIANQEISAPMRDVTWDAVEQAGLRQTLNSLNSGFVDPEFALRAAVAANKAIRSDERQQNNQAAQAIANTQIVINVSDLLKNSMKDVVNIEAIQKPVFQVTSDMRKVHNGLSTDELLAQAANQPANKQLQIADKRKVNQIDMEILDTPLVLVDK